MAKDLYGAVQAVKPPATQSLRNTAVGVERSKIQTSIDFLPHTAVHNPVYERGRAGVLVCYPVIQVRRPRRAPLRFRSWLIVYLGPCPPCFQVHRPPEICFCGKESRVVKCVDYDPDSPGWSCGQPCLSPMDCNAAEAALSNGKVKRHSCRALCHAGPCPPCHIKDIVACYCGKHTKEINCSEKEFPMLSQGNDEASHPRLGFYQCEDICGRFDTYHILI